MANLTTRHEQGPKQVGAPAPGQSAGVVFIDLDGSLIQTDLLHEAVAALVRQPIALFLRTLLKLVHGRAAFKRAISESITPDIKALPFRGEVLEFIAEQRALGVRVILATASDSAWAQRVAGELGVFEDILASDGTHNLKGTAKLDAIQAYCRDHGYTEFDYLGDSYADLPIWREARGVYVVAPSKRLLSRLRQFAEPAGILGSRKSRVVSVAAVLRPHQWVKNVLIFVPLMTSHNMLVLPKALAATVGFACFCLCASAAYILNDIADISGDRRHPTKRKRAFASGDLPISWGLPLAAGLLIIAFVTSALTLSTGFSIALAVYFLTTCAYSFFARRVAILDVMMLAGLYTIRVLAGGQATATLVSEWLMAFSMFLFVSLAFAKRYAELDRLLSTSKEVASGRGYRIADIGLIESMGAASGYIAVLVLALYVNGEQMKVLYRDPWPLWLVCVALMYWIGRVWIKAKRGELSEDPIVFALRDRTSLFLGVSAIILVIVASYL